MSIDYTISIAKYFPNPGPIKLFFKAFVALPSSIRTRITTKTTATTATNFLQLCRQSSGMKFVKFIKSLKLYYGQLVKESC